MWRDCPPLHVLFLCLFLVRSSKYPKNPNATLEIHQTILRFLVLPDCLDRYGSLQARPLRPQLTNWGPSMLCAIRDAQSSNSPMGWAFIPPMGINARLPRAGYTISPANNAGRCDANAIMQNCGRSLWSALPTLATPVWRCAVMLRPFQDRSFAAALGQQWTEKVQDSASCQ